MNQIDVKEIIQEKMNNDFRASQMYDVLSARIMFLKAENAHPISQDTLGDIEKRKAKIEAYEDCISILKKEFIELRLPFSEQNLYDERIRKVRDKIVEKLCPIDNSTRGAKEYTTNMHKVSIIADTIESLCYEIFDTGYKYGRNLESESPRNTDS